MTDQEIDKWVEEHVTAPEDSKIKPAVVEWGKMVAHKFYELGKEEGAIGEIYSVEGDIDISRITVQLLTKELAKLSPLRQGDIIALDNITKTKK